MGGYQRRQGPPLGVADHKSGSTLWSRKVVNDETVILDAIGEILSRAESVSWAG